MTPLAQAIRKARRTHKDRQIEWLDRLVRALGSRDPDVTVGANGRLSFTLDRAAPPTLVENLTGLGCMTNEGVTWSFDNWWVAQAINGVTK